MPNAPSLAVDPWLFLWSMVGGADEEMAGGISREKGECPDEGLQIRLMRQ